MLQNIPVVKPGIIAVSRDCFPIALSQARRAAIVKAYGEGLYECPVTVENEKADLLKAVEDVRAAGCNALVVFLGNFGPETPETLIAQRFEGPCMFVAAAEGDGDMINGRGDAYCGLLNCSYNLGMRHLSAYIPEDPVGTAEEIAQRIRGLSARRPRRHRREEPQDHHLRPPAPGLLRLQRPHQGPLRAGRGNRGEQRAGPAGVLQGARGRPPHRRGVPRDGRADGRGRLLRGPQPPHGAVRADAAGLGREPQGRAAVRGLRRQVLARLPQPVRL